MGVWGIRVGAPALLVGWERVGGGARGGWLGRVRGRAREYVAWARLWSRWWRTGGWVWDAQWRWWR